MNKPTASIGVFEFSEKTKSWSRKCWFFSVLAFFHGNLLVAVAEGAWFFLLVTVDILAVCRLPEVVAVEEGNNVRLYR